MKKILTIIKNFWQNERSKAWITLGLWGLFFIISFSILNYDKGYQKKQARFDNYEYDLELSINDSIYHIEGIRYQEKELIEVKELNQEYSNDFSEIKEFDPLDLKYLRLENLQKSIEKAIKQKKVTYQDGSFRIFYEVKAKDFIISDFDHDTQDDLIKLEVKYKNNILNQVTIDVTNKMKKYNKNVINYNIDIRYTNIGNIKDFMTD